jgi:hypothetical protein
MTGSVGKFVLQSCHAGAPVKVEPSSVPGIELIGPGTPVFDQTLEALLTRGPCEVLRPALPYSVIARNRDSRAIVLLGIRFDMVGKRAKSYSVVHYADTLRYPEKADLIPGAARFVCAEPLYTDLVLRRSNAIDQRGRMNLDNLRTVLRIRASLDCVAFADGQFAGPDSLGGFNRFQLERDAELALIKELQAEEGGKPEAVLERALAAASLHRDPASIARKVLARRLQEGLAAGGTHEMYSLAQNHRTRLTLWR